MDVSIAYARDHLTSLLRRLEAGEPVVITRHGKAVAELRHVPPAPLTPDEETAAVFEALLSPPYLKDLFR